ncbi:MAG: class I SAM-dependent methyltransferase [Chloroflexota bacterium]|nr:class I SAM-dependent methyltransferase [Chloroflexota bacterium]
MYKLIEISLADTQRLLSYKRDLDLEIHLNIKGFDYGWILNSVDWKPEMKVLDVGAGYSRLPLYIARTFGCEVWSVDDFGIGDDGYWTRNQDPNAYISENSEVKYILEKVGDSQESSLPENYFDVIYSASALEHIEPSQVPGVWLHMSKILKSGGLMLHALDIAFPTSRRWPHVLMAAVFDVLYPILPNSIRTKYLYETPKSYVRYIAKTIDLNTYGRLGDIGIVNMVINPEIVIEPLDYTLNRMLKDGDETARYFRVGSLQIALKKTDGEG